MNGPLIEKLIQRQINQWNSYREVLGRTPPEDSPLPLPTITISRQIGAGGRELAEAIGARLGLQVHGHEIVDHIAHDRKLETRLVAHLDEQVRSELEVWVTGALERRIFLRDDYHVALVRAVRTLASRGGVALIGRGANFILGGEATLRLRVVAPVAFRASRLVADERATADDVKDIIHGSDTARERYVAEIFHAGIDDSQHYDLVLNADRMTTAVMLDLVLTAVEARTAVTAESGARVVTA